MGRLKRIVIFALAAIAVAAGVWFLGSRLMGAPDSKENSARWPFGLGTIDEVPAHFPQSKIDATAERVKTIGRRLPSGATLRPAVQSYLSKEIARSNDHVEAPPAAIRHFLDEHVAAIDELRTTLAGGAPPRWAIDINRQSQEPSADLAEQLWLVRLLAADAFDHHSRGDDATAWRDAETGWMLAQGLWAQSDLTSRLVALSATRMMNAVAAKLSAPAPDWHRQLLAFDADRAFAAGLQVEAWTAMTAWDLRRASRKRDDGSRIWETSAEAILRSANRQRAVTFVASRRTAAEEIGRTHACGQPPENRSGLAIADLVRSRVDRFHVEREATSKLLALKEQRRRSGEWPEAMPGIADSVCGKDAWSYRREADGTMSLAFRQRLDEESRSALLPLSFRYPK